MLTLAPVASISVENGGLFVSRGSGIHPRRKIDSFELIFVTDGKLSMQEEDKKFEVEAGQSLLLWPNRLHFGTSIYDSNLRFFWVHFFCRCGTRRRRRCSRNRATGHRKPSGPSEGSLSEISGGSGIERPHCPAGKPSGSAYADGSVACGRIGEKTRIVH